MLGWMSRESLQVTLDTGWVTFHSRSRGRLWTKGEPSGHRLALASVETDCDGDTLLVQARPQGPTCHLGRASCFAEAPAAALAPLDEVIAQRERERPAGRYTTALFAQGVKRIAPPVGADARKSVVPGTSVSVVVIHGGSP